ncbi:MAG: SIR2 family protein [Paludibacteraceae bacterium]|nr:SIR2 family protein [Paludibacteraceae bacterium]
MIKGKLCEQVLVRIKQKVDENYTSSRKKRLALNPPAIICVGAGISADVNFEINKCRYLWNDLVYAVTEEALYDHLTSEDYIQKHEKSIRSLDIQEYKNYVKNLIHQYGLNKKILDCANDMECVEYCKSMMGFLSSDADEEWVETIIGYTIRDIFYSNCTSGINPRSIIESHRTQRGKHTLVELSEYIKWINELGKKAVVISYNYDDYLEESLDILNVKYKVFTEEENENEQSHDMNIIYHVHGFIPFNEKHKDDKYKDKEICGDLVFSENSYNQMSDQIYRWSNRSQVSLLSKNPLLFIGFSASDINFRRLMHELNREKQNTDNKRYIFVCYKGILDEAFRVELSKLPKKVHVGRKTLEKLIEDTVYFIIQQKDEYFQKHLGAEVIWFYDISEISSTLLKCCTGELLDLPVE